MSNLALTKVAVDFGKHIGGARKEEWSSRGLSLMDLDNMNAAEKEKFVKKDSIWKKPDYDQMIATGVDIVAAYAIKKVRDSIPSKPFIPSATAVDIQIKAYIKFVTIIRDGMKDIITFDDFIAKEIQVRDKIEDKERCSTWTKCAYKEYAGLYPTKLVRALYVRQPDKTRLVSELKRKQFGVKKEDKVPVGWKISLYAPVNGYAKSGYERDTYYIEKGYKLMEKNISSYDEALKRCQELAKMFSSAKTRKASATPKQLKNIRRTGLTDVRNGRNITGDDFIKDFHIRGGEFGLWMTENDAQSSLNMAYEAFCDFADVLGIPLSSVSFDGRLSIAFGARGKGDAVAHYEPMREVINITKMKGAGSLGHEMFHALDDIVGKKLGLTKMMTQSLSEDIPESVQNVINSMKYRSATQEEINSTRTNKVELAEKRLLRDVSYIFPETELSDEVKAKRGELIAAIKNDTEPKKISLDGTTTDAIETLSDYKKEITGRVIPKERRRELYWSWFTLMQAKTASYKNMKLETEYYKESQKMDNCTAKDKFGYWSSTTEMFARAGACYISDFLSEKGGISDYLSGHSESCVGLNITRQGEVEKVFAMPRGKERIAINKAIHEMIEDLKIKSLI